MSDKIKPKVVSIEDQRKKKAAAKNKEIEAKIVKQCNELGW